MKPGTISHRGSAWGVVACVVLAGALGASLGFAGFGAARVGVATPTSQIASSVSARYLAGDLHTHTWLSPDGARSESEVATEAFAHGLDWFTATDHGGVSVHGPGGGTLSPTSWMWKTLVRYGYPAVVAARNAHPAQRVIQGLEWHVPGHDHAGVGIVENQPAAISEFEYRFDSKDASTARPTLAKHNRTRADAIIAVKWLKAHYATSSYVVVNHPSRKLDISVKDLRDLNNAAPGVAFGFEGIVGHQKLAARGDYGFSLGSRTRFARTYGGADYFLARVGGVWDSLLGEGRHFWVFADSDFHNPVNDFWPGEYAKTFTFAKSTSYADIVGGMRYGNSFTVTGGLVDRLSFRAANATSSATMGQTLVVRPGADVTVTVVFRVPSSRTGPGKPVLDHLDLIYGLTHAKAKPGTTAYLLATNSSARVLLRRKPATPWTGSGPKGTEYTVTFRVFGLQHSSYIRLRGTNLGLGLAGQTDAAGNPLIDSINTNTAEKAWADCWLYSDPIFIRVAP